MNRASDFATPQAVTDLDDCLFYHTTDLPRHRTIAGPWDLRPGIASYLGGVSFHGKRILDVGSASGFLSFHMEREGGEVVSYDLSEAHVWDHVPYAGTDLPGTISAARGTIRRLN